MIGLMASISPTIIAQKQMIPDTMTIALGLPFKEFKQGRCSSSAIAKSNLGALAKLYKPAPVEESIIPTATNQCVGQAT